MKKRILGLDTGTNSLGWAVVDCDEYNNYTLVKHGSLIFQEGVKIEKKVESSKAAERTGYRSLRKHYFRRRLRKIEVLRVLIKHNLCPYLSEELLHAWHVHKTYPKTDDFMLWQRTSDNDDKNPYYYRHLCLHQKLDLEHQDERYILGRAFYHLAQRRGFLSNRLDSTPEQETGKVQKGISDLTREMEAAGCEYLGDYFYQIYSDPNNHDRIRTRYTDREQHYKKEFHAICEMQQLSQDLVAELDKALYFQRPLKSQRKGVGKCTFEPKCPRCAESHPDFEEFRMLSFINNIKIKTPRDLELRCLSLEEKEKIRSLFYRVSKPNFDFEDIAKALAGKGQYQYIKDVSDKPYKFNYRMTQGVPACPTTAQLIKIFGDDWKDAIAETYRLNNTRFGQKSVAQMVDDMLNVLSTFSSDSKLQLWAEKNLQLNEEQCKKFAGIKLSHGFASLSLKAIHKILPFLRQGYIYSHAVELANIPVIVGQEIWNDTDKQGFIIRNIQQMLQCQDQTTKDFCIKDFLLNNFELNTGAVDKLYHPSMIEAYKDAEQKEGIYQLGSPRTNAIRNPMAMRSLHEMRKVINLLLREKIIDSNTEVHVEYARGLNDANMRKAIADYQRAQDQKHQKYQNSIKELYLQETGRNIDPTETDIRKYELWEEQSHKCLYTGAEIGIADFLGDNPKYDIEHTIPRSIGGDSIMENLTLCDSRYNRDVKKAKMPSELANHEEILTRIEGWKKNYETLTYQIDKCRTHAGMSKEQKDPIIQKRHRLKIERNYWKDKYERFTMTEPPSDFSRRQGAGIGLISKYAGLYLKSLFHDPKNRNKSRVFTVKGTTTAEFRRMWGLQSEYEKKCRDNHCHHCIDAITIACIGKQQYEDMASFYHDEELYDDGRGKKPQFRKPWPTFTEDVLNLEKSLIIVHDTPNNIPKKARKYVRTANGKFLAKGDCARDSLHKETYYGAIERDGEIKYVVRKALTSFEKETDIDNIVDDTVREIVRNAVRGKTFKEAIAQPIYMNKEKGILIKKVRCFAQGITRPLNIRQQRDISLKEYKQTFHVANDTNYCMAIYEGLVKNKIKRDFELVKTLDAVTYFKDSTCKVEFPTLVPSKSNAELPLKSIIKIGTMVLLYENTPAEIDFSDKIDLARRLYKVVGLSSMVISGYAYGIMLLRYHQEARQTKDLKSKNGRYKNGEQYRPLIGLLHTQFDVLVEGFDFHINALGDIELLNR